MSVFFTDSNSEIWYEDIEKLGIEYISMPYTLEGIEFGYDLGKTHNYTKFFSKIRKGVMPITNALNPNNYIEIFEPFLKQGEDIIYVTFSRKMSGTFDFMDQAIEVLKEKYPERTIKYVDTKSISIGAALIAYEAAVMHKRGATDDEIVDFVTKFRNESCVMFTVDDLMHLKKGGRISSFSATVGTMLGIKPILAVDYDGVIQNIDKVSGRKKAIQYLANAVQKLGKNVADYRIYITHADCEADALELKTKIMTIVPKDAQIIVQPIGPTVGTHCGPNTLGIAFHAKSRI